MKKFLLSLVLVLFFVGVSYPATDSYMFTVDETLKWRVTKHASTIFAGQTPNAHGNSGGTLDPYTIFTVTGDVIVRAIVGIANVDVVAGGGTATISVGTASNATGIIGIINANNIPLNGVTYMGNASVGLDVSLQGTANSAVVINGADIVEDTASDHVDSGQMDYYIIWAPLEAGSSIVP